MFLASSAGHVVWTTSPTSNVSEGSSDVTVTRTFCAPPGPSFLSLMRGRNRSPGFPTPLPLPPGAGSYSQLFRKDMDGATPMFTIGGALVTEGISFAPPSPKNA